jgi:hypothetical protein
MLHDFVDVVVIFCLIKLLISENGNSYFICVPEMASIRKMARRFDPNPEAYRRNTVLYRSKTLPVNIIRSGSF